MLCPLTLHRSTWDSSSAHGRNELRHKHCCWQPQVCSQQGESGPQRERQKTARMCRGSFFLSCLPCDLFQLVDGGQTEKPRNKMFMICILNAFEYSDPYRIQSCVLLSRNSGFCELVKCCLFELTKRGEDLFHWKVKPVSVLSLEACLNLYTKRLGKALGHILFWRALTSRFL